MTMRCKEITTLTNKCKSDTHSPRNLYFNPEGKFVEFTSVAVREGPNSLLCILPRRASADYRLNKNS